jgi:hypothetical protein
MQVQQKIAPTDGKHVRFGKTLGTRRVLPATATGGGFGLVEYDLPPGQLDSPVHTHQRENEYSCVLSGRLNRAGRRRRGRGRPWRAPSSSRAPAHAAALGVLLEPSVVHHDRLRVIGSARAAESVPPTFQQLAIGLSQRAALRGQRNHHA